MFIISLNSLLLNLTHYGGFVNFILSAIENKKRKELIKNT